MQMKKILIALLGGGNLAVALAMTMVPSNAISIFFICISP
jgi:hypothetical protein